MPKVSVVIPVYGAEKYIKRCACSLFEQTLDSIEYIFVDDCTPDKSMDILIDTLNEYPERKSQVRIIPLEKNSGQSVGRAIGMEAATGEYLISCDSDDWVEPEMYETMYDTAKQSDVDMVMCDVWFHKQNNRIEYFNIGDFASPHEMLTWGKFLILWSMCDKMIKTEIIHKYRPYAVPGMNMWEDVCSSMLVMYYAKTLKQIHRPFYHYDMTRYNTTASSPITFNKVQAQAKNLQEVFRRFGEEGFDMGDTGMIYKRFVRDNFLILRPIPFAFWRKVFPEVVWHVYSDKQYSLVYRLCYVLATYGCYIPFKLQMWFWKIRNQKKA